MSETQTWRAPRVRAARRRPATAGSQDSRHHRAGLRFWALLNAPALLTGAAGTPGSAAAAEDDHRRLAGPWAG
ncbi:MAG TPA: hypothetical protein VMH35_28775 [Streptosporangiaceae bacterium]|nr:hypothetical protein [Streptosporangiaceae bacterium]